MAHERRVGLCGEKSWRGPPVSHRRRRARAQELMRNTWPCHRQKSAIARPFPPQNSPAKARSPFGNSPPVPPSSRLSAQLFSCPPISNGPAILSRAKSLPIPRKSGFSQPFEPVSRDTIKSRNPSKFFHAVAAVTMFAWGSMTVKPSSVTRTPRRSIWQNSWDIAR